MSKIIGIDLGTTNSCVAISEGGAPRVLENSEGSRTTPSVVAWKGSEILVGQTAKNQAVTNSANTVYASKRLIGRRFTDDYIQEEVKTSPFVITENDKGDACIKIEEEILVPSQVSAHVLSKMKKSAEDYLGEKVTQAVITVPAYFNDAQRQATKDAGRIAGLEVKRIINEPTAAALAFGLDKKGVDELIVAVFDLGGGTFDISVIEICKVDGEFQFEVRATNGDTHLGGEDFDKAIINFLVDEFKKENGIDLTKDNVARQRLKETAEKVKIELSSRENVEINLPFITAVDGQPKHLVTTLTRAKFEELVFPLVERCLIPVEQAIKDADLKVSEIEDVILVGGMTRMPLVQREVAKFFGKEPRKDVNPDEAVALGAAVQGAVLAGDRSDVLLLDVTPLTLGLETLGGVMTPIIERNTTIPTSKSQIFSTAEDSQEQVTIRVLQGERKKASENKMLGNFNLIGIPQKPRGEPQIEVTFDLDADGIIHVTAKDKGSGKVQSIEVKDSGGLSEAEINRMVDEAEEHAKEDQLFQELISLKNTGETLTYSADKLLEKETKNVSEEVVASLRKSIDRCNQQIKGEDRKSIEKSIDDLQGALQEFHEELRKSSPESDATENSEQNPDSTRKNVVDVDDSDEDKKDTSS